jgi:hypothetical protein
MALMKTGRKMSMPKGEDPKKPKAQQEVKVTAQKQNEPPQKRYYTQEEYNKNEATKARNRAAKEQYESDVANYNRSMKIYKEGPESIQEISPDSITATNRKSNSLSAEKMNKDISEKLKKGELVPINDPSLDPETRKIISEKFKGGRSDVFGNTSDRYVSKGTKYSGDKSSIKIYETYKTPEQAKAPTYEKEENIGLEKVIPEKMKLLKPTLKTKKGELAGVSTKEKGDWEAPSRTETKVKTRFKGASNANTFERGPLKSTRVVDLKRSGTKESRVKGYNREANMAKAYFGGGYEGKSKFDIEGSSEGPGIISELKGQKKEMKARIRAGEGDVITQQGRKAELKDIKSNIRQAKLASKYVTKLGQEFTGVTEGENLYRTGKIKTFTPEAMAGFSGSKQNTYDVNANKNATRENQATAFRNQMNNPANRNTISSQIDKLEPKRTRAQRIEERDTQKKVMRNLSKQ